MFAVIKKSRIVAMHASDKRESKEVVRLLRKAVSNAGYKPEIIVSDGWYGYDSKTLKKGLGVRKIKHVISHFGACQPMLILKSQKVNKGAKPPIIFGKTGKEASKMQALELLFAKLFKKNYVDIKIKIKACLLYYLGLSLRKAAKLLNISHETVRKIYKKAKRLFNPKKKNRKAVAVDDTKLYGFYVFAAIDVNSNEIIAIYASKGRSSLDALIFMKKVLKVCIGKPELILCDKGKWYNYAFKKLGLNYKHEKFGLRNAIERWFFLLKHRTKKFYNCFHAKSFASKFKAVYEFCLSFAALYNLFYARR